MDQLYRHGTALCDEQIPKLMDLVREGGAKTSPQQKLARALAQAAGCEPRVSFQLLCQMCMSPTGEDELQVLNPLLDESDIWTVVQWTLGLMLVINRCAHLARALSAARRLLSALGKLRGELGKASISTGAAHAASAASVLSDQLALLLSTERTHVKPSSAAPGAFVLDPRILAFEFCSGYVLRPQQVQSV